MNISRRDFVRGLGVTGSTCVLDTFQTFAAETPEDWKAAFARAGFDPAAPGCSTFIVIGDPHVPWADKTPDGVRGDQSKHLAGRIATWNAMRPSPRAVLSMGDQISTVTGNMGDRNSMLNPKCREQAKKDLRLFRSYFDKLEIPFYQTIGNHDAYPGEKTSGAFYKENYPEWEPYGRYDLGGATLINLCGGHDGSIDPEQRAWLRNEAKTIPNECALLLMAHYPDVGVGCVAGYDIGVVIREMFSDRTGETWLLAGHNHVNTFSRYHLPGGGLLCVATHAREPFGYWVYGLRNGSLVARVLVSFDRQTGSSCLGITKGKIAVDVKDKGVLPLPFEHESDKLLWKHLIGSPNDEKFRVSVPRTGDAGSYLFYVGKTTYRLPLAEAKGAKRVGLYGQMLGHRQTHEPEGLQLSNDGEDWTPIADPWRTSKNTCYSIDIPEALREGEWLYVRVNGFGFGCDSSLAGFALLA